MEPNILAHTAVNWLRVEYKKDKLGGNVLTISTSKNAFE